MFLSVLGFVIAFDKNQENTAFISGGLLGLGLQGFFVAFLVDVFTDIRWYLKGLVERQEPENRTEEVGK